MDVDVNDIVVFSEVVAAGSFTAAGKKLGLPPSAVSRRVARLEATLGFPLLHRTTRQIGLTDSGRVFHEHISGISQQIEDARRAVDETRSTPSGLVRVTAPPDDGGVIWSLLSGFVRDHPDVDLELIHTLEYLDLIAEGIDVALRGGSPPDSTLFTAHKLFDSRLLFVASPAYLARCGTPTSVRDLEDHECIAMDNWAPNAIRNVDGEQGPVRLGVRNRVRVNRLDSARQAALEGFGIAPLLEMTCWDELRSGALVEVLPDALPGPAAFWAIYPVGRRSSAAAQALVEHIIATAARIATQRALPRNGL